MIDHIVLIRWKEAATTPQIHALKPAFESLRNIAGVRDVRFESNLGRAKKEYGRGIAHVLTVSMQDLDSLERFGPHPVHREMSAHVMVLAEEIIIVDIEREA